MLKFISKTEKTIESIIKVIVLISTASMVMLVFVNVILRYIFNSGIPIGEEISRFFFIWMVLLGAVLAFKDNEHVGISVVIDKLKGIAKKIVLVIGNILTSVALCYLSISSIDYLEMTNTYTTPAAGLPFSVVTVSLVICSFSLLVLNIFDLYRIFKLQEGQEGDEQEWN